MLGISRFKMVIIYCGVDVAFVAEKLYCFSGGGGREGGRERGRKGGGREGGRREGMEGERERERRGDREEVNERGREK